MRGAKDAKKAVDTLTTCFDDDQQQPPLWDDKSVAILQEKFKDYMARLKAPPRKGGSAGGEGGGATRNPIVMIGTLIDMITLLI